MSDAPQAFRLPLTRLPDDPLGYAGRLVFDAAAAEALPRRDDGSRRYLCAVGGLDPWHAALLPDGDGAYFIIVNKARVAALEASGRDLGDLGVTLAPDRSDYGMAMPAELGELLAQDGAAHGYFHGLTPGKQRALIHQVASAKREATRLRRAVEIVEYLAQVRGALDVRELQRWRRER